MENDKAIFAIYHSDEEVHAAVQKLEGVGISTHGILIVHADHLITEDRRDELHTDILQGSLIGALVGAACGVMVSLTLDRLPLMMPLSMNLAALAVLCTLFGLLLGAGSGALVGIGTPEPLCKRYSRYLAAGDVLLAVPAPQAEPRPRIIESLIASGGFETALIARNETLRRISRHFVNPSFFGWARINGKYAFSDGSALKMLRHELGK